MPKMCKICFFFVSMQKKCYFCAINTKKKTEE